MDYPVRLTRDSNGTFLVTFPDFPEAQTFGDTRADALVHAADALATVLDAYVKDRRDIPRPSPSRAGARVSVPVLTQAKLSLYETMRRARVNKSELARRLRVHPPQVDRILDVRHGSQVGQLEAAFSALGKRLTFSVSDAQPQRARTAGPRSAPRSVHRRRRPA